MRTIANVTNITNEECLHSYSHFYIAICKLSENAHLSCNSWSRDSCLKTTFHEVVFIYPRHLPMDALIARRIFYGMLFRNDPVIRQGTLEIIIKNSMIYPAPLRQNHLII